jgi:hypothetical protein
MRPVYPAFDALQRRRVAQHERARGLTRAARQFDRMIRRELQRLGTVLWGADYALGIIPIRRYRVRFQPGTERCVWRVEHDIPPYEWYRCTAYQIQLALDDRDAPVITVHSRAATHGVTPLVPESLRAALVEAAQEAPLIISRDMGEASDG